MEQSEPKKEGLGFIARIKRVLLNFYRAFEKEDRTSVKLYLAFVALCVLGIAFIWLPLIAQHLMYIIRAAYDELVRIPQVTSSLK